MATAIGDVENILISRANQEISATESKVCPAVADRKGLHFLMKKTLMRKYHSYTPELVGKSSPRSGRGLCP